MSKRIIIISSIVDSTIRESQRDANIKIFLSLEDLGNYIENSPLRADNLFFTSDVLNKVTTGLSYIISLLENPFLKVDNVTYITSKSSEEIPTVEFIIDDKKLKNWEIVQTNISRENISGIIDGTLREDKVGNKKRVVFRQPRDTYIKEKITNISTLDDKYISDEEYLDDIPDEEMPIVTNYESEKESTVIHIVGNESHERTALTLLVAQYISLTDKVLILEKDVDYHLLSDMVTKINIECLKVDVSDLIDNLDAWLDNIRYSTCKLIVITSIKRINYNYNYIFNLLYNNLSDKINVFIKESTFSEIPIDNNIIVVFSNTMPSILEMCENLDYYSIEKSKFLAVNMYYSPDIRIPKDAVSTVVSDVLCYEKIVDIINISSIDLTKDSYDIGGVLDEIYSVQ